ncbi:AAA domain protein [Synechococcus sp. RS9907]|uniref:AAA family ATPase n=1 Tax=Synechococcus sp. RS9907 TaxID=221350 RepID=UPI0018614FCF|nr:AAA family ATPase [Synechococcus sp. RS9907]QNI82252.1 AAA domain protein [Synechococcus sp. RS9907]
MLLLSHWGDVEAFKPPVLAAPVSLAEMMAEEFVPPVNEPAGEAWNEASSLTDQWWYMDRDSDEWKEREWELWDLWLALQSHYDNDNSQYNQRCIENGREQFQHLDPQVIGDIEEFKAQLILRRGKFPVVIRQRVDGVSYEDATNYKKRFNAPDISRYYLSAVQRLKHFREAKGLLDPAFAAQDELENESQSNLKKLSGAWEAIKLMPSPTQRRLAHQKLRKDLGIADKEYKSLMHSLLVEQSDENVRLDSIDAVKRAAAVSKERAVVDRFLMAGAVSIVAAEGGCGKTSLLYAISEAISNGSPLFGQLPTIKGHVVIIEADESWRNSAEKWTRMDYSPNKDNVYTQWAWDPSKLLELEQTIQKHNSVAVLMDSFATLFSGGGESMNDSEIGLYLYTLNQMAARTGTAILVTHHLKKGASRDNRGNLRPITLADLFGSSYIVNGASDVWALWRTDDDGQHFQLRYLKDRSMLVERNFDFQLTGSDESLRFNLHGGSLHELEHRKTVREKLLSILRHSPHQWFTVERLGVELKEASKFSASYSDRAVRREMSQLYVEAAVTGVDRRRINDGKPGRPKFEYAFVR